jgi:mono/diheme cytochrome c family protein
MMRHLVLSGSIALAIGAAFACGGSSSTSSDDDGGAPVDLGPEGGGASLPASGPAGTGLVTGLPCDVQAVLEDRCLACHSGTMAAAPKMLTYDDMVAKSKLDPTKTLAQLSLERMKSTTSPMPPPPAVAPDATEIKTFADWVAAGTPKGAVCTDTPPSAVDGGALDGGGDGGDGGDGGSTALKCTSGKTWTQGNTASPLMHPGLACNACHQVQGGPNLRIAGTVYPSLHEPNDCDGKGPPPALTVIITDKNGKTTNLPVNSAGNFFTPSKITPPYKAKITDGVTTRAMNGSVTAGDCNSCHTVTGANGAPGRVMAP